MPIFEYCCKECNKPFEHFVMRGELPEECPHCKSKEFEKQVSRSSFVLKGSGWYGTDYGRIDNGDQIPDDKGKKDLAETPAVAETSASTELPKENQIVKGDE